MADEARVVYFGVVGDEANLFEEEYPNDLTVQDILAIACDTVGRDGSECQLEFNGEVLADDALIGSVVSTPENRLLINTKGATPAPLPSPAGSPPADAASPPASPPPADSPAPADSPPPAADPAAPPDVPKFGPPPEYPDDEIPPWAMLFDEAVADLADAGYDVVLARQALELAGSYEVAEKLLEAGTVTKEGLEALGLGAPEVQMVDGDDAIRALKSAFDDRESVQNLKEGKSVEVDIPDGKGGILTFILTPTDADTVLKGVVNKSLEEFQPGDEFRPDLKPFPLPDMLPPMGQMPPPPMGGFQPPQMPAQPVPQVPPPEAQPARVENPGIAKIKAENPENLAIFGGLSAEDQEAVATLVDEYNVPFLSALEQYSMAEQDIDVARAALESLQE
jgi:hypothetical protein